MARLMQIAARSVERDATVEKKSAARAIGISERYLRSRLQRLYSNGEELPY